MSSENTVLHETVSPGGLSFVIIRPDRVVGELPVEEKHCDARGMTSIATLFDIADRLGRTGITARFGEEIHAVLLEAKSIALRPAHTNLLTAEALPLPAPDGLSLWQTTIRDEDGETAAILAQGYMIGPAQKHEPKPVGPVVRTASQRPAPVRMLPIDARTAALVAAGTEVIARKGFSGATIREIAEQAGVHVPTFYQHIASKDELLEMVYAHEMKQLEDELDCDLMIEGSARERLEKMISSAVATSHRRKRQIGILNRELKSLRPDARARVIAQYRRLIGRYETVIREGIANGEFSDQLDPTVVANVADMVSDMWALRPFFFANHPIEMYRKQVTALIISGLCVPGRDTHSDPR